MKQWIEWTMCALMCTFWACVDEHGSGVEMRADIGPEVDATTDIGAERCSVGMERSCGPAEGQCSAGVEVCLGETWSRCVDVIEPSPESCDGIDEDCDGRIDEGVERACGSDVGACAAGREACIEGTWAACAGQGTPVEETCNGTDDDCDGRIDELAPERCGTAEGACIPGGRVCVDGAWGECSPVVGPDDESCDGLDDEDCDGTVDEGCACPDGATRDCGEAAGVCVAGQQGCVAGAWGACVGATGPDVEVCNDRDDDCDGRVDESLSRVCGVAVGVCVAGVEECSRGAWSGCDAALPTPETCDGRDEDCDGRTDELIAVPGECGVGRCRREGMMRCVDGVFVEECTPGEGIDEICNALDDDCDGTTDEAVMGPSTDCGVGACQRDGVMTCQAGAMVDTCQPGAPAADEQCDGIDTDCDGATDEAWMASACGLGVCAVDAEPARCLDGVEIPCRPVVEPMAEACNAVDDDCDGIVDEGIENLGAPCFRISDFCERRGTWVCDAEGAAVCSAPEPQVGEEICNGEDDDCDGATDEIVNAVISPVVSAPFDGRGTVLAAARGGNILVMARQTDTEAVWLGIFDVHGQVIEPWWPFEPDERILGISIWPTSTGWAVGFRPRLEPLADSPLVMRRLNAGGEQARADILIGVGLANLYVFDTVWGYRVFFNSYVNVRSPLMLDLSDDGERLGEPVLLTEDPGLPAAFRTATVTPEGVTLVTWSNQGFRDPRGYVTWRLYDGVQRIGGGRLCDGCRSPGVGYGVFEDDGQAEISYRSGDPSVSVARISADGALLEDRLLNQTETLHRFGDWRYRTRLTANGSSLQYMDADLMPMGEWVDLPPNLAGFIDVDGEPVRVRTFPAAEDPMGFAFYRGPLSCNPPD